MRLSMRKISETILVCVKVEHHAAAFSRKRKKNVSLM